MTIDAWVACADAVIAAGGEADDRAGAALAGLGLTDDERGQLTVAIAGRADPAGLLLRRIAEHAAYPPPAHQPPPPTDQARMDVALALAADLATRPLPGIVDALRSGAHRALRDLPAPGVAALLESVVARAVVEPSEGQRAVVLGELADATEGWQTSRMPVATLALAAAGSSVVDLEALGALLAPTPTDRLLRELARALGQGLPIATMTALLHGVTRRRESLGSLAVGAPPPEEAPPPAMAPPPAAPPPAMAPPPVFRGGTDPQPEGAADGARPAYPRLDLTTGTARPDVVVVDVPFTATVGLAPRPSRTLTDAGAVRLAGTDTVDIALLHDPDSITLTGPTRHTLTITADVPFPSITVEATALYLEDAPETRRLGVQYLVDGQVVGLAWARFIAVDDAGAVASAPAVPRRDTALLDLAPLVDEEAPDLVISVCASDTSPSTWVWTAYAHDPAVPTPDRPSTATLATDVAAFALDTRRAIAFSSDPLADYLTLAGRARRIGEAVPDAIHAALAALLGQPGRTTAPSVLLLTEEVVIPWELAEPQPAPTTPWGGASPFLGAHVAIGRWPLGAEKPRPLPRPGVTVTDGAVVTADYTGVPGWGVLDHALAEADAIGALFTPAAARIAPDLTAVIDLLRGTPPADIIHVALHGQFDDQGDQEGIVLVARDQAGTPRPQFLTPLQLETGQLAGGPFVFLNACQVGADERVLAGYGGFASTLLRIGASGVVAPLWNIDDDVADALARTFYERTWTAAETVGVAEAVRAIRATYTEAAARAGAAGASATTIAFQVFGHPRLRLLRPT